MGIPADQIMALTQRCAQAEVDRDKARARVAELEREHEEDQGVIRVWRGRTKRADARVAELEAGISTAMQLIEGGFDSAAYEALEALNAHK